MILTGNEFEEKLYQLTSLPVREDVDRHEVFRTLFAAFYMTATLEAAEREVADRKKLDPAFEPKEKPKPRGPFPWQKRLAARVWSGDWPRAIALPTAAGKTTCLDIAVFALACGAKEAARRIFFVVDRRIVVDQAFEHAKSLARTLDRAEGYIVRTVADRLREIARPGWAKLPGDDQDNILRTRWAIQDEPDAGARQKLVEKLSAVERGWVEVSPLDVYALRGGMYRETAWARSPLQPTVVASTVDQVGSRLLFRGYGVSDGMKPVHAGLVGNDALILLDEAHCAKPFDQTMQAVRHYRGWNPSPAPFHFVSITATPTGDVPADRIERDNDDDRKHVVLGKRINATKPAKLVTTGAVTGKNWRKVLVAELAKQARALAAEAACVGVIVNRVATARDLRDELRKTHPADVVLLTGRMRPLDRDAIYEQRLKPLLSNATEGTPPTFVIGTQALEVGADFDFHALVTECASLDALRQRFGRLNRVANREKAPAVVVVRADQAERSEKAHDPVYGDSLPNTWDWLTQGGRTEFDFGVAAVREAIKDADPTTLNAPSSDAPVLFPVHLDCWVQTSPKPEPDPDPAPFLHGPKDAGEPDVQVVFRDDLGEVNEAKWTAAVALCPPSSSEAVAVRIGDFRRWLAGQPIADTSTDVEHEPAAGEVDEAPAEPRFALRWKGEDDDGTGIVSESADPRVRPGDLFVVPCRAAGVAELADFPDPSAPPPDYAEEAFQKSRDKALLRLTNPDLNENDDEFESKLSEAIRNRGVHDAPAWLRHAIDVLTDRKKRIVSKHPVEGWVVTGKRRLGQFAPEFLDDAASSYSPAGGPVALAAHSAGVADHAGKFASALGLPEDVYRAAGFWHDLGKLDGRFQKLLKGYAGGAPLAKSGSFGRRPWASHGYPRGARHELLSAALLTGCDDLFLHLITTHHGHARPFAPAVDDADEAARTVGCGWFGRDPERARQDVATWNGELPCRFWRVVRAHGWWGAAYHEAVFRLADHTQSAAEQADGWEPSVKVPTPPATPPGPPPAAPGYELPLPGLDGANPLAFLAALGTLVVCDRLARSDDRPAWLDGPVSLSWGGNGSTHTPVLHFPAAPPPEADFVNDLADGLASSPETHPAAWAVAILRVLMSDKTADVAREFQTWCRDRGPAEVEHLNWVSALICESAPEATSQLQTVRRDYMVGNLVSVMARANARHLARCLFRPWDYADALDNQSLHWEPSEDRRHAYQWHQPNGDPTRKKQGGMLGANRLALEAWPLFPGFPAGDRVRTRGFRGVRANDTTWSWPLWTHPLPLDAVGALLGSAALQVSDPDHDALRRLGVLAVFRCNRILIGKTPNLTAARAIP